MLTQMNSPKMKFWSMMGMMVKGMQNTARSRSLTDRFSKNTFVTVRIPLFCMSVIITSRLPTTDNTNIRTYRGIVMMSEVCRGGDWNGDWGEGRRVELSINAVKFTMVWLESRDISSMWLYGAGVTTPTSVDAPILAENFQFNSSPYLSIKYTSPVKINPDRCRLVFLPNSFKKI